MPRHEAAAIVPPRHPSGSEAALTVAIVRARHPQVLHHLEVVGRARKREVVAVDERNRVDCAEHRDELELVTAAPCSVPSRPTRQSIFLRVRRTNWGSNPWSMSRCASSVTTGPSSWCSTSPFSRLGVWICFSMSAMFVWMRNRTASRSAAFSLDHSPVCQHSSATRCG